MSSEVALQRHCASVSLIDPASVEIELTPHLVHVESLTDFFLRCTFSTTCSLKRQFFLLLPVLCQFIQLISMAVLELPSQRLKFSQVHRNSTFPDEIARIVGEDLIKNGIRLLRLLFFLIGACDRSYGPLDLLCLGLFDLSFRIIVI